MTNQSKQSSPTADGSMVDSKTTAPGAAVAQSPPVRRILTGRRVLAGVAVAVGLASIFHNPLLRGVSGLLVVVEPHAPASAILVLDGDKRFDVAARRVAEGTQSVLLIRRRPGRLERMGILPAGDVLVRRELSKRHVPAERISWLSEEPVSQSETLFLLGAWLHEHSDRDIDMLCDCFSTRVWKMKLKELDSEARSRVHLVGLSKQDYDQNTWWRSKQGCREVVNSYLSLAFHWLKKGDPLPWKECPDQAFEAVIGKQVVR